MRSFQTKQYQRGMFAPPASDTVDARVLGVATAEKVTVPADAKFVVFSATADFYAKFGDTNVVAAVPGADVADGTACELNPAAREIPEGMGFVSLIAPAATVVTLSWYAQ